jgi:hypothetical protein
MCEFSSCLPSVGSSGSERINSDPMRRLQRAPRARMAISKRSSLLCSFFWRWLPAIPCWCRWLHHLSTSITLHRFRCLLSPNPPSKTERGGVAPTMLLCAWVSELRQFHQLRPRLAPDCCQADTAKPEPPRPRTDDAYSHLSVQGGRAVRASTRGA